MTCMTGEQMGKIGFMVGHQNYKAHAALLTHSIAEHTKLAGESSVCVMTPAHTGLDLALSNVSQMEYTIPEPIRTIPFIDKMLAAAAFEETCGGRYLWMDVDSYFFQHPPLFADAALCVNPVDKRNIGDLFGEPHSRLWRMLYEYFGLNKSGADARPLYATASGECI